MAGSQQASDGKERGGKPPLLWVAIPVAGLVLCLYSITVTDQLGSLGGDNARYLLLADALYQGKGYVEIERLHAPPHTQYPPLFPVLLAPLRALEPGGYRSAHWLIVASALAAVVAVFFLLRGWLGSFHAALGAALLALLPVMGRSLLPILTELPFMALSLWALVFWEAHARRGGGVSLPLFFSCLFTAAAFLTRTAGIVLVITLVLAAARQLFLRPGRSPAPGKRALALALVLTMVTLPVAGWILWTHKEGAHHFGYVQQFFSVDPYQPALGKAGIEDVADRARKRIEVYGGQVPGLFLEGARPGETARFLGSLALGLLFVLGGVHGLRRPRVWHLYLALYAAMVLVWPWMGERFLLPVLPLLTGLLVGGGARLQKILAWALPGPVARTLATVPAAILLLVCIPGWIRFYGVTTRPLHARGGASVPMDFSSFYEAQVWSARGRGTALGAARAWGDYLDLGHWISCRDPSAVTACRKPRLTALTAGISTEGLPGPAPPGEFLTQLRSSGARYVISLRRSFRQDAAQKALDAARATFPGAFRSEYALENAELLGISAPAGGRGAVTD